MGQDRSTSTPTPSQATPLPPGAARRRELRQQRRAERWRNLWRLLVFCALSAGLGTVLLRQGWILKEPSQVEVSGSRIVSRDQVLQAGHLHFPLPLLELRPRQLGDTLAAALPVEQVRVSRWMLPPRLRIELVDREAVAQAQRRSGRGLEQGYVDRLGNWMTSRQQRSSASASAPSVQVLGWQERLRPALALILARRDRLGSPLQQVRFEPNGSVWLRTVRLGNVHLGPADARLERRLDVLQHLSSQLPQQIRGIMVQSIDLSDPDRPELGLPAPPGGAGGAGRATAGVD